MTLAGASQERWKRLHALSLRLAAAVRAQDVAETVVSEIHDSIGASGSVVYFADEAGVLRLAGSRGIPDSELPRLAVLPPDSPAPLARAIAEQRAIHCADRSTLLTEFPRLASSPIDASALQAIAAVPLMVLGRTVGGLAFSFARAVAADDAWREFFDAVAAQSALAVERARLVRDQVRSRDRLAVLAEASRAFAAADDDMSNVLATMCREVAGRVPSSCTVHLLARDGETLEVAALHHVLPEAEDSVRAILAAAPVKLGQTAIGVAAQTGKTIFVPDVPPERFLATARPGDRAFLERWPLTSLVVVPLRAGDAVLGTVTVGRGPPLPPLSEDDRSLLEDIADRAALAVVGARRLEEARTAAALAQDALQTRDAFLALASHELKTPLSTMTLQAGLAARAVRDPAKPENAERLRAFVDATERSVARMVRLVDDMLDVGRIRQARVAISLEPADLGELVADTCARHVALLAQAGCDLHVDAPLGMHGAFDRFRIDQVVSNLLTNAARYGAGAPVDLALRTDGDRAELRVRDRGVGVRPEDRERIFSLYERASDDRNIPGLGLGLFIVRQIVDMHGGSVRVETPQDGPGATFVVQLPLKPA